MPNVQDQIKQARAAGYSDDEIAAKVATLPGYAEKFKAASSAGYKNSEILGHLSGAPAVASTPAPAPAAPPQDNGYFARLGRDYQQAGQEGVGKMFGAPAEALANLATGIGSSAVGGIRGLAKLATGGSLEDASNAIRSTQEALTYQPRTGAGKGAVEIISAPIIAAKEGGKYVGGAIGGAVNGEQGRIAGEAIGDALPDVAGTLLMGGAGMGAARARANRPAPAAPTAGPQSAGAAASEQYRMAQAGGASPEVLAAIEKAGSNAHPVAVARHTEASSLPVPIELTPGQASGNPALISFERNNRGKYPELADKFNRQNEQMIANFDEVRAAVAPEVAARGSDLGQMAVDAYKAMDDAVRADISAKYKALEEANGGAFPIDGAQFATVAETGLAKSNKARFLPAEVRGILDDVRESGAMTFGEFENYRTILAEEVRGAKNGNIKGAINIVRNALEEIPLVGDAAALKPLADAARNAARTRFENIKADPAYKAVTRDLPKTGEPSPLADKFIQSYVVNGKSANVQNMLKNLEIDPLNQQIIAAGVIDHLKTVSGVDARTNVGNVSQAGLNSALTALDKKSAMVLGTEAAATVEVLGNVVRNTMKQSKGDFVNNSNTTVAAKAAEGATSLAMHTLDRYSFGMAGGLRNLVEKRRLDKSVERSMQPGAGINAADFPALLAEMEAKSTAVQVPVAAPESVTGNLAARVAQERANKMKRLSEAQSVDDAIRAASGE